MTNKKHPEIKKFFRPPDYIQFSINGLVFHGWIPVQTYKTLRAMIMTLLKGTKAGKFGYGQFYRIIGEMETLEFVYAGDTYSHPGLDVPEKISVLFIREFLKT